MLTKKDTYTLHELLIDANEKTQSYVHIMKQGNDGSAECTSSNDMGHIWLNLK